MNKRLRELIIIGMFPAMMAATSWIVIPLGFIPPITLQVLFVFLAGLLLKPTSAAYSMVIYLLIGLVGLPVFAGFVGGPAALFGPTGGFLFGFVITAYLISLLKNVIFINNTYITNSFVLVVGLVVLYMCGISYFALYNGVGVLGLIAPFSVYIPGDLIKAFTALTVYVSVHSFVKYEWA